MTEIIHTLLLWKFYLHLAVICFVFGLIFKVLKFFIMAGHGAAIYAAVRI